MSSQTAQPTSTTHSPAHSAAHSAARATRERLTALITQPLADAQYELVDVVASALGTAQASVQVFVDNSLDHPLGGRIDLDGVSAATRIIDAVLEAADPIDGAFTLEVSSPGLERALRTPSHFQRFVGTVISVKTVPDTAAARRVEGRLVAADVEPDGRITMEVSPSTRITIAYASIERARTVFVWGPQAKPGTGPSKSAAKRAAKAAAAQLAGPDHSAADDVADELPDDEFTDDDFADDDDFSDDDECADDEFAAADFSDDEDFSDHDEFSDDGEVSDGSAHTAVPTAVPDKQMPVSAGIDHNEEER